MKKCCRISVLCVLALVAGALKVTAQSATSAQSPTSDPAITPLSVMGVVTELKPDARQVIITTAAGSQVIVSLSDRTDFRRIPPGEKTKDKFVKIAPTDFGVGDSVFARGRMSEDRRNLPALEFYVMSKGDIAEKRERERNEWRTRGIAGTISAVNAEAKTITIDARTPDGLKPVIVDTTSDTRFRRYAPNSIRFSDAITSSFAELTVGDQLRALGNKSADGTHFKSEEVISGSFQTIGGTITEINPGNNEIKINDVQSHQPVTIVVRKDSTMRRLTAELLALLSPKTASPSGAAAQPGANSVKKSGDLQEMFDQLPILTLQELKVGESILISSTKSADPTRRVAIAIVSGVDSLLKDNPSASRTAQSLGAMSLGGP